jgi:hypothetical protein
MTLLRRLLGFLSLTLGTQAVLMLQQLLLLPMQIRVWGADAAAQWFVVIAVANVASLADLGLRVVGHAELLRIANGTASDADRRAFAGNWTTIRLLFVGLTAILLSIQIGMAWWRGTPFHPWMAAVTITLALDTLLIVRGMYLDTLKRYRIAEGLFFAMVTARVLLQLVAILLGGSPAVLGWIMFATGIGAIVAQGAAIRDVPELGLWRTLRGHASWRDIALARYTLAEPVANWVRLSLPVIVLATMASSIVVAIFVALRALFGMSRQAINQLGRFASVEFVHRHEEDPAAAARLGNRMVLLALLVGAGLALAIVADDGRLLELWLRHGDRTTATLVIGSFAVGAASYCYQLVAGIMIRMGEVRPVAMRQYVYIAVMAAGAGLAWLSGPAGLIAYLLFLGLAEVEIATSFLGGRRARWLRPSLAATSAATFVTTGAWLFVALARPHWIAAQSLPAAAASLAFAAAAFLTIVAAALVANAATAASRGIAMTEAGVA